MDNQESNADSKIRLIERLNKLNDLFDTETAHQEADAELLAYINDPKITKAFEQVNKWYA